VAGITPVSCIAGSEPTTTRARKRALGVKPSASARSRSPTRMAAAPSEIWEEFPAVTTPSSRNTVLRPAIFSGSRTPRMPSSLVTSMGLPSGSRPPVGSISVLRPSRAASEARSWLRVLRASTSSREMPHVSAMRSALSP
jgi:hypothetical protein